MQPKRQILLVEDFEAVADVTRVALEREGYEVTWVGNGDAAIERLDQDRFDLVISDVDHPGRGAEEILVHARARNPELPVLLSTGHLGFDPPPGWRGPRFSGRLLKPWSVSELRSAVRSFLPRR